MKINCLAVDDEPLALDVVQSFAKNNLHIEKLWTASNAISASEMLRKHKIDLVFLDIQMPQISGLDFVRKLENPPLIVFTTAFSEYAVEGFEVDAIDYLLKPFSEERFEKAVIKAINIQKIPQKEKAGLVSNDFIFIKANHQQNKVYYKDIKYVEAYADYVKIFTTDRRFVTLQTMKNMETKLPEQLFVRVHRSFIVGLNHIQSFTLSSVQIGEQKISIGKNYKDTFQKALQQNKFLPK